MRLPTPYGPPVQPVFTSQTRALMLGDLLAEHLRVDVGIERQERRAEAGAERRLRLGDALLGAGDLAPCSRRGSDTSRRPA